MPLRRLLKISIFISFAVTHSQAQDTLSVLLKNSLEVVSIDPMNENFNDLLPLMNKIGKARVVVLGEISHTDGASLAFKSRMVKFLHQKMGFDVLAWEASELDCRDLNTALRSSMPLVDAKRRMMLGGWDNYEAVQPVFEYARASWSSNRPLEMMGFDSNRPPNGAKGFSDLLKRIYTTFPHLYPGEDTAAAIDSLTTLNFGFLPAKKQTVSCQGEKYSRPLQGWITL